MTPDATAIARAWLGRLNAALAAGDAAAAATLFGDECYWRDLVALTWNIRTVEGRDAIAQMLNATLPTSRLQHLRLEGEAEENGDVIEAWFSFETAVARGKGHLRLRNGLGFTLLTTMGELKGFEERSWNDARAWHRAQGDAGSRHMARFA